MKGLKQKLGLFLNDRWPFIVIVFLVVVFFWRFFILGQIPIPADFVIGTYYPWLDYKWGYQTGVPVKNPIMADVVSSNFPMRSLAVDLMKGGQIPLWNPYILAGIPLLANFQSAPFSPTIIFYFIFEKLTAWSLQVVFQHLLAAVFLYLLLRYWKISKFGSLFGAIVYAFSGHNIIWSQWNAHTLTAAFIPLVIFFESKWLDKGLWKHGFLFSISIFLQFMSGYPQIIMYSLLVYSVLPILTFFGKAINFQRFTLSYLFIILGVGLSSLQLLPSYELLRHSQREIELQPYEWAFLPFEKTITFLAPDYFGNHVTRNYWGPQDYTSNTGFLGVVGFSFTVLTLTLIKKSRIALFLWILVILGLVFSFLTPVSYVLWRTGFLGLQAATASRAVILFVFAISALSGFGIDYFIKTNKLNLKPLLIPGIILLGFTFYPLWQKLFGVVYVAHGVDAYSVALRNIIFPTFTFFFVVFIFLISRNSRNGRKTFFLIPIFLILIFELFRFGWKFTPFSKRSHVYPDTPVLSFLKSQKTPFRTTGSNVIPINMRMVYGIEALEGYDPIYPATISEFIAALNSGSSSSSPQGRYADVTNLTSPLLSMLNTRYLLTLKKGDAGNPTQDGRVEKKFLSPRYEQVFEDKTTVVLEDKKALPRAFMVYEADVIQDKDELLTKLLSEDFDFSQKIALGQNAQKPTRKGESEVSYDFYSEQKSLINVRTSEDGYLFISDLYFPGWKAYLDKVETPIYRANYTFRSIFVPKGRHVIEIKYEPFSFKLGVLLSLIFFILLISTHYLKIALVGKEKV